MRFARGLLIFSYGLFSIAAQTLLFREFITAFEGNDISVGIFFSTWFLWVGAGALIIRGSGKLLKKLAEKTELLLWAYLPAFVIQAMLIIQARELAGIESYALWSIRDILLISIIVNAPVSLVTGILFPIICQWVELISDQVRERLPVSRVYMLEAAGSFAGGIGMTVLLALGVNPAMAFFILAFILSASISAVQFTGKTAESEIRLQGLRERTIARAFSLLMLLCVCLSIIMGVDKTLMRRVRVVKWTKLLPKEALAGSFQTPQAEYLYGTYQGQWVAIREGSVVEVLPDESGSGKTAAIVLCQMPNAKWILVIGSGLGLCRQFLSLPQIESVTWAHCDSDYVQKVNEFIPPELRITDQRFEPLSGDVRSTLAARQERLDIVILNLPDATSSVLNRYYTAEFYRRIKQSLSPNGILAVRTAGGENIMGTELVNLGASTKLTLESVFSKLVLTPGEDTWFIASDSGTITGEPGTLRDRFASIENASRVFTPEALLSVYLPERAEMAMESYMRADLPAEFLINRDEKPLTHLWSLLLAAKQSGAPAARLVKHLVLAGPLSFLIPILIFIVLRVLYVSRPVREGGVSIFDSSFLVFSTGAVGIGAVIVLMYLYQTLFGSLYLYIGVVSSLFMAGLTAGAASMRFVMQRTKKLRMEVSLFLVIVIHILILGVIAFWPGESWTHVTFAIAFILSGLCTGCYFPVAAGQLAHAGVETSRAGSVLETADHIGASVGGIVTSLALVPVLGAGVTLLIFVALILANIPAIVLKAFKPESTRFSGAPAYPFRGLGYGLFGVGVSIVLCSNLLARAGAELRPSLPQRSVRALAGELRVEQGTAILADTADKVDYFRVFDANDKLTGYIFSSLDLAPEVRGFGGKINLAVYVDDPNGEIIGFHIVHSNETPAYLELLDKWCDSLVGHHLFKPEPFADIHTVTGATISSEAIVAALRASGHRFAEQILNRSVGRGATLKLHRAKYLPDARGLYLIGAVVLVLIVTFKGGFWSRLVVLISSLVIGGLWLNAQYSSEQIVSLLSGQIPVAALTGVFLFVVIIPLIVLLFGNLYCGYICPFGAAQELISYVMPAGFKPPISTELMRMARLARYVVLLVIISVFFLSWDRTTLRGDPLISIFGLSLTMGNLKSMLMLVVAAALIGSIFYTRFWCLYLCPVGAFLSLLNSVAVLKRFTPAKKFGKCSFGLTGKDQMDCIQCDKCRFDKTVIPRTQEKIKASAFVTCVLAIALFVSMFSVSRFMQVIPTSSDTNVASVTGGQPRDVDLQRIREMIRRNQLSDKESEFYKRIE